MRIVDTLSQHLQTPAESLQSHLRRKQLDLAGEFRAAKKVYLDTKFWLLFRDARLGRAARPGIAELLNLLTAGVARGKVIDFGPELSRVLLQPIALRWNAKMTTRDNHKGDDYLRRLPPEYYRGEAYVHWSMTMRDRQTGWLIPIFYYKYRELLTHTMFRYALCCPIYCCMPDHIHLLWIGMFEGSD